jgi:putative ABC transport system permease protein
MFWRIVRRLISANRGRLIVILLALGAGAAVTAALLNLQVDAKHRLTNEFRVFGANVVIAPKTSGTDAAETLDQSVGQKVLPYAQRYHAVYMPVLYVTATGAVSTGQRSVPLVVAGGAPEGFGAWVSTSKPSGPVMISDNPAQPACIVGVRAAAHLNLKVGDLLLLRSGNRQRECRAGNVHSAGGPEDDQVATTLELAQSLAALPNRISFIQLNASGTSTQIQDFISDLQKQVPEADVHGIRQFTEAEGKIYERISGLLTATVAVVLILTTLCVMAAMTNVAMERKNDVGLMKAIGGATRRVLRLFLAEAATLGLIAGLIGAAAGLALSVALGKAVFGVAAQPRLIVYPVVVALTIVVAVAGAYPLRRLAGIRPASVFRGEA